MSVESHRGRDWNMEYSTHSKSFYECKRKQKKKESVFRCSLNKYNMLSNLQHVWSFELKCYLCRLQNPNEMYAFFDRKNNNNDNEKKEHTVQLWINVHSRNLIYVSLCYKSALLQCILFGFFCLF